MTTRHDILMVSRAFTADDEFTCSIVIALFTADTVDEILARMDSFEELFKKDPRLRQMIFAETFAYFGEYEDELFPNGVGTFLMDNPSFCMPTFTQQIEEGWIEVPKAIQELDYHDLVGVCLEDIHGRFSIERVNEETVIRFKSYFSDYNHVAVESHRIGRRQLERIRDTLLPPRPQPLTDDEQENLLNTGSANFRVIKIDNP